MSEHSIEIVEVGEVLPHPNADQLEVTRVWGWQCCVRRGEFKPGSRAIYIPPDYLVPTTRPEFSFLQREGRDQERISVRKLRGQISQGLLIPVPENLSHFQIGYDVAGVLGVVRYEPPIKMVAGGPDLFVRAPSVVYAPKFDIENYQRYSHLISEGETVVITEKIHGANARYVYSKDEHGEYKMFAGSRTNWVRLDVQTPWAAALRTNPGIEIWCKQNVNCVLYGEVFGPVQSLKYGAKGSAIFFAALAAFSTNRWFEYDELVETCKLEGAGRVFRPPLLYRGPFNRDAALALAEGDSSWPGANHEREGVVILRVPERTDPTIGRVILKMVSNRYLEKRK